MFSEGKFFGCKVHERHAPGDICCVYGDETKLTALKFGCWVKSVNELLQILEIYKT